MFRKDPNLILLQTQIKTLNYIKKKQNEQPRKNK